MKKVKINLIRNEIDIVEGMLNKKIASDRNVKIVTGVELTKLQATILINKLMTGIHNHERQLSELSSFIRREQNILNRVIEGVNV